MAQILITGPKW